MADITLIEGESLCLPERMLAHIGKGTLTPIGGIYGRMVRKLAPVGVRLARRRLDITKNKFGGIEQVERLETVGHFECLADVCTGILFDTVSGRCLSTHQLHLK